MCVAGELSTPWRPDRRQVRLFESQHNDPAGCEVNSPLQLTVLGTGYLGITHAACLASLGFGVLGVDTDPEKVSQLTAGHLPIYEPGLGELVRAGLDSAG